MLKLPLASEPPVASRLQQLIAPLSLEVSTDAPKRINLLVSKIELDRIEDSEESLQLARRLARGGEKVRVVSVDEPFYLPSSWREDLNRFEGLEGIVDAVDLELAHDRSNSLQVSPDDRFVATTWWTAQIAHRAGREVGAERFLYLIPEYEPLTMPMGSEAALARQSYEHPHHALYRTELLRDYFRDHGLGAYAAGGSGGEASTTFEDAIAPVSPPAAEEMRDSERKLLFHVQPDLHAEQNLFELGLIALAESLQDGTLDGWVINGIGPRQPTEVRYGDGLRVKVLAPHDRAQHADLLRGHSVGLSLMLSPNPGTVPLEMAAAGMPVVTNTFENKTGEALAAISENLVAVDPTIEGIKEGIREAVTFSTDRDRRVRGAEVKWSRDWDDSFGPDLIERLLGFLERA